MAVAAVGYASTAFAHAEPAKVSPGDGAVLNVRPAQIEIEMSQEMARRAGANDIDVFDAGGNEVTVVSAVIDNGNYKKLTVSLPLNLPVGTYTVKWKTLSDEDGDPADGKLSFTFDPSKPADPGKVVVREDLLAPEDPAGEESPAGVPGLGGDSGRSWALVAAVAIAAFAIGSGGTFLLVQKRA